MEKNKIECEGWVVRDEYEYLCVFSERPFKKYPDFPWIAAQGSFLTLSKTISDEVQWKDEKPINVKITIEKI